MILISAVLWAMTLLGTGTWWPLILIGYLIICTGFSFLFGPLFTLSLGSIQPQFYSHGSALLGSIQQVAGAAGVALLDRGDGVARRSRWVASIMSKPWPAGIRSAFLVGAIISLFAIVDDLLYP